MTLIVIASMGIGFFLGDGLYKKIFILDCKDFKRKTDLEEYVRRNPDKISRFDWDKDGIMCEGTKIETVIYP